jgi:hypothetical protein
MKIPIYSFVLFILSFYGYSQTLPQGWSTFSGKIDNFPITISIFSDENDQLSGNYCYNKQEKRISIKGTKKGSQVYLEEFIENKKNASFEGSIDEKTNSISGKWIDATNNKELIFNLNLSSRSGETLENRYFSGIPNESVELFMKKTKESIIKKQKDWLSQNIKYPIFVSVFNKRIKIKNQKEFLEKYSGIFSEKFINEIKKSCSCDLFSNYEGAMFADGLIWVYEFNENLKITTINN